MFSVVAASKNDVMHAESIGDEERGSAALKLMSDLLTGLWAIKQVNLVKQTVLQSLVLSSFFTRKLPNINRVKPKTHRDKSLPDK